MSSGFKLYRCVPDKKLGYSTYIGRGGRRGLLVPRFCFASSAATFSASGKQPYAVFLSKKNAFMALRALRCDMIVENWRLWSIAIQAWSQ